MWLDLHELVVLLDKIEVVLIAEDILITFCFQLAHSSLVLYYIYWELIISLMMIEDKENHHLIVSYYQLLSLYYIVLI